MRRKIISNIILIALVSQVGLGTGCAWWRAHFGGKKDATPTNVTPLKPGEFENGKGGSGVRITDDPSTLDYTGFGAVHFDYDSATIKPSEFSKIEAVATALKGNSKKVVVAGHTDERGTAEYNRALGERRAQAGREALMKSGVDGSRISTISFGKDRPVEASHGDTAWSLNRRDEFAVVGQ